MKNKKLTFNSLPILLCLLFYSYWHANFTYYIAFLHRVNDFSLLPMKNQSNTECDHFLLTLMSSRTLNSVSQISARWSMRSSAWRPRIKSFRARQLRRKKNGYYNYIVTITMVRVLHRQRETYRKKKLRDLRGIK